MNVDVLTNNIFNDPRDNLNWLNRVFNPKFPRRFDFLLLSIFLCRCRQRLSFCLLSFLLVRWHCRWPSINWSIRFIHLAQIGSRRKFHLTAGNEQIVKEFYVYSKCLQSSLPASRCSIGLIVIHHYYSLTPLELRCVQWRRIYQLDFLYSLLRVKSC